MGMGRFFLHEHDFSFYGWCFTGEWLIRATQQSAFAVVVGILGFSRWNVKSFFSETTLELLSDFGTGRDVATVTEAD